MMAAVLLAPASAPAQVTGFTSGVTAGEVTAHTAIVWGRTDKPAFVVAQVAKDKAFQKLVRQRSVQATKSNNNTVQTQFDGFPLGTQAGCAHGFFHQAVVDHNVRAHDVYPFIILYT